MGWVVEYWDGSAWQTKKMYVEEIVQELNGHEEAILKMGNTAANRDFVSTDKRIRIKWNDTVVFTGMLYGAKIHLDVIECVVYNECYEKMKAKVHTNTYNNVAANTILSNICTDAGVVAGSCPTTPVSVRFSKATCFDAATFLADALNKDFWADYDANGNPRFNIGQRASPDIVLDLHFDEGSGTTAYDKSRYQNNGTIYGATWVDGKYGKATSFDGVDDHVKILNSSSLALEKLTIVAWIYPESWGEGTLGRIVDKNFNASFSFYLRQATPNALAFGVAGVRYDSLANSIVLNKWQHVVVTFDYTLPTGQIKFYIDGVFNVERTRTTPIPITTDDVYIGNSASLDRTFDGLIDEVRIYNRALTADEIKTLYETTKPLKIPSRGIDRAKKRDKVIIRGVDVDGNEIFGEAGTGTNVAVFTEKKASDVDTLNTLAAKKLAELNKESSGVKLPVVITEAYNLSPGDYISLNVPEIGLVGNYRIWKLTKKVDSADVEVDRPEAILEQYVKSLGTLEELGIYPSVPEKITVQKVTLKNPSEPNWLVAQRNVTMQDMTDPNQRIPTTHIDQTLWTRKDFFCQGFVGADSLYGVVMSGTNYVAPDENSLGKMVYRVGDNAFMGFLGWYAFEDNERRWFLIVAQKPNVGDTLYIPVTGAKGTVTQTFIHTGGGAIQLGDGFETPMDNPRITLSKSEFGKDVLDVMTLGRASGKVRLKEVWFGGKYVLRFSATGYVGCVETDIGKYVVYQARAWNNELKTFTVGTLSSYDNVNRKWIVEGNGQNILTGTYVYVSGGTGAGYLSETSASDIKLYRYQNAVKLETPSDGGLAVEQGLYTYRLLVDSDVYLTNLPTI